MMTLFELNDDEIKRIMSVIERDFQLREKEAKRLQEIRRNIQREHQRVEYLVGSKEFNASRCIRCFKPFKFVINPKEMCSQCQLYVCHDCAKYDRMNKIWVCQLCEQLKDWQCRTAAWFYEQSGKKYKRCGSAKIVRSLYKRESDMPQPDDDDDLGYDTLRKSQSIESVTSYVVHDRDLRNELNEYAKRLNFLIDHLHSDLSGGDQSKVNVKDHLQQMTSEISRARMALSRPVRRLNKQPSLYESDLQNLLIQITEEVVQINLQEFQQKVTTTNFDQKLAQMIMDKYIKQSKSERLEKFQRQSTGPFSPVSSSPSTREFRSRMDSSRQMSFTRTPTVDEEDIEEENDHQNQERTPTEKQDQHHHQNPLTDSNLQSMITSTERVADWKLNCTLVKSTINPSSDDEPEIYSTWF